LDTGISSSQTEPTHTLAPQLDAPSSRPRWLSILALISGLAALTLGPLAGGLFIFLSLKDSQETSALGVTTIGLSMAALGLGFGGTLAWAGYASLQGRRSRPFWPAIRWFWGCLAGLVLALAIGQAILSFNLLAPPLTFPFFHVLGVALPALAMLLLVGYGMKGHASAPTQRQMMGQMALGAFGATAIAFTLEALAVVIGLIAAGMVVALTPGGLAQLAELRAMLADPTLLQDPQALARWLLNPAILVAVAMLLAIVAPMIEEGAKSIGVPLLALATRTKPAPAQGWLWGIAVGAGFAIAEGLFNGAANLPFWAGIVLLRVGATAMHMVAAGITGLGWARTLASRRPWPLLGGYVTSVTLHGLWNGLTVMMVIASLWVMAQPGDSTRTLVGGTAVVTGFAGLLLLAVTIIGVSAYITLRVRRASGVNAETGTGPISVYFP
jgi:RsiW-degrading membrane proteinase PrsW (M82 family)